ncbi:YdgA family protein [Allopusillimonas soli]|uniref:YdgA family protein n=1 Tax=Allopusillimonas soli TaxID=659016 RepID=A0A853F686_9BURK|nr:YdgA family protein [Allopusillimonas soli]NYT35603.1 YdgA family protein [Allopusillimonas soli]
MKKSTGAAGVVLILCAAWLGATWYVGKRAEDVVRDAVVKANERMEAVLGAQGAEKSFEMTIERYDRGLFSSDVVYGIKTKGLQGKPMEIHLRDHMQHGPFPLAMLKKGNIQPLLVYSVSRLEPTLSTQAWIDSQEDKTPVHGENILRFSGDGQSHWTFSPLRFSNEGTRFEMSAGTLSVDFHNDFQDSDSAASFSSMLMSDENSGEVISLSNIQAKSQTAQDEAGALKSRSDVTVDALQVGGSASDIISLRGVTMHMDTLQQDDMLQSSMRYDFGKVLVGEVELGSFSLGGKIDNVDMKALMALASEYDAIKVRQGVQRDADVELTESDQQALLSRLEAVLASSPTLALDPILWKNAQGESSGSLKLDLGVANADALMQPSLVPPMIRRAELDLSVSRPMVIEVFGKLDAKGGQRDQLQAMGALMFDRYVGKLTMAGLAKAADDKASTHLVYTADAVDVNGTKMTVQEFLQRAMLAAM